ncbi:UDP-N-acetylmuramoyl-tripeptide--D-alanyl-D-alanine ligase [Edwardsiella tarda]|nr:UDP-N-acetylmuramoyl-tripeptide--D-alanyl-D-alanine ligase [Edwardsiella tarda]
MIATTLRTLADAIGATLYGDDAPLAAVTTDTRKLTPGCLFIALQGRASTAMTLRLVPVRRGLPRCW